MERKIEVELEREDLGKAGKKAEWSRGKKVEKAKINGK